MNQTKTYEFSKKKFHKLEEIKPLFFTLISYLIKIVIKLVTLIKITLRSETRKHNLVFQIQTTKFSNKYYQKVVSFMDQATTHRFPEQELYKDKKTLFKKKMHFFH